jgi:hypothetical protein
MTATLLPSRKPASSTQVRVWRVTPKNVSTAVASAPVVSAESSSPEPVLSNPKRIRVTREAPRPKFLVAGEPFFVEQEDGVLYIRHARWSLLGCGPSFTEAYKDLLNEARELIPVFSRMSLRDFDADAFELYRFVLRVA